MALESVSARLAVEKDDELASASADSGNRETELLVAVCAFGDNLMGFHGWCFPYYNTFLTSSRLVTT